MKTKYLKESNSNFNEVYDAVHEVITRGKDDFYNIVYSIIGRIDDYSDRDDIMNCIDDELIYDDDIWEILKHYQTPYEADYNSAIELFISDIYSICKILSESDSYIEEAKKVCSKYNKEKCIYEEVNNDFNPLVNVKKELIIEFDDGGYVYIDYDKKTKSLIAGGATNLGIIPEYTMLYDFDKSVDVNLQEFGEYIENERLTTEEFECFKRKKVESVKHLTNEALKKEYKKFKESKHKDDLPIKKAIYKEMINRKIIK